MSIEKISTYVVDYGCLAYSTSNPLDAIELLADAMRGREWSRLLQSNSPACVGCDEWDHAAVKRLEDRPNRPGAKLAADGCKGCLFAHVSPRREHVLEASPAACWQRLTAAKALLERLEAKRIAPWARARLRIKIAELESLWERYHRRNQQLVEYLN